MMGDILSTNTQAVATLLAQFRMQLAMLETMLIAGDEERLSESLLPIQAARKEWAQKYEKRPIDIVNSGCVRVAAWCGEARVPGDKSISHRAVMLAAIARGKSQIRGWLAAGDTEATLGAMQDLGARIDRIDANTLLIDGGTAARTA